MGDCSLRKPRHSEGSRAARCPRPAGFLLGSPKSTEHVASAFASCSQRWRFESRRLQERRTGTHSRVCGGAGGGRGSPVPASPWGAAPPQGGRPGPHRGGAPAPHPPRTAPPIAPSAPPTHRAARRCDREGAGRRRRPGQPAGRPAPPAGRPRGGGRHVRCVALDLAGCQVQSCMYEPCERGVRLRVRAESGG